MAYSVVAFAHFHHKDFRVSNRIHSSCILLPRTAVRAFKRLWSSAGISIAIQNYKPKNREVGIV